MTTEQIFTLPQLEYNYNELSPFLSEELLQLHHSKHHAAYVAGANAALEQLKNAREKNDFSTINQLEKNLAFNVAGHVNHSLFWKILSPNGGKITTKVESIISKEFGSFDQFKAQFNAAALGIQGSGWVALGINQLNNKLYIYQIYNHQDNLPIGTTPVLLLDMWEHAFYLDYKNVKANFVENFWNFVNWEKVEKTLTKYFE